MLCLTWTYVKTTRQCHCKLSYVMNVASVLTNREVGRPDYIRKMYIIVIL